MPAVPVPPAITGGVVTTTELAAIVAVLNFLQTPPAAVLRQTVAQSIPTGSNTAITFDTKDSDTAGGWSSGANTRYTAQYPGRYNFSGGVSFTNSAVGQRGIQWYVNGSILNYANVFLNSTAAGGWADAAVDQSIFLNIGDFVELRVFQNTGGALLTQVNAGNQAVMSVTFTGLA